MKSIVITNVHVPQAHVTSADFGYPFKGLWFPIIWLFSLLTLSIPNEDYSRRVFYILNYISMF